MQTSFVFMVKFVVTPQPFFKNHGWNSSIYWPKVLIYWQMSPTQTYTTNDLPFASLYTIESMFNTALNQSKQDIKDY